MKVGFKNDSFAFEFVRNLGFMYYGGADLGEMVATAAQITEGDVESWYAGWQARAGRTLARADACFEAGHRVSAREAYLRASTYFRMADFYLHGNPGDPRIMESSQASARSYAKAAELTGPTWEPVSIRYEDTILPGYFYKVDNSGKPRPTLVFHGGFDSSIEELFYFGAAAAVRRGYNCLTFDGPGQGMPIREGGLPFRHDWEKVVTPAVDYALTRQDVDGNKLALMGMSLGGYMAARAAAFEHRFKAAIFFDGIYDFYQSMRGLTPKDAIAAFDAGDEARFEELVEREMLQNTAFYWTVTQAKWSFAVPTYAAFLKATRSWTMQGLAEQIRCPCLVMEADGDMFFRGQPQQIMDELRVPKTLATFGADDGAENHCQSGALAYKDQVVFDWLDQTIGT